MRAMKAGTMRKSSGWWLQLHLAYGLSRSLASHARQPPVSSVSPSDDERASIKKVELGVPVPSEGDGKVRAFLQQRQLAHAHILRVQACPQKL
mmetsp:Transcript_35320/g.88789  ORF Transcript_35320/g.88789 Transcript_35320/m.88789 type:complete len:93 (-) Transcript_35320:206-484(-)